MKVSRKLGRKSLSKIGAKSKSVLLAGIFALGGGIILPLSAEAAEVEATETTTKAEESSASETPASYTMDEMVVTAQRTETREIETPATTIIISEEQLKNSGYRNAFEAIDQQIGVTSTSYGDTGTDFGWSSSRITLRGYDRGTLIMVNGMPMNLHNYGSLENIPLSMIERIEIIKGAAATLYGPEAMGGVINVILKKPPTGEGDHVKVSSTIGNEYKSAGVTYLGDRAIVEISREWTKDRPHSSAFGSDKESTTDWWVGKGKKSHLNLSLALTDELSLNYNYTKSDITRGGPYYARTSLDGPNPKPGKTPSRLYDYIYNDYRQTANLTYQGKDNGIKAMLGYNYRKVDGTQFYKFRSKNPIPGGAPIDSNKVVESILFDLQKNWKENWGNIIVGYSFRYDKSHDTTDILSYPWNYYFATAADQEPPYTGHRTTHSLFTSWTRQFSKKFALTLGLRGELIDDIVKRQDILLPQIQTEYKFDKDTAWYINIGRAFQMPTIADEQKFKALNGHDLDPEDGWTYETGVKLRRGKNTWKAAVYYMDMENKFGFVQDHENHFVPVNKGNFRNTGIELEYGRKISDAWEFKAGAAFSNPKINNPQDTKGWVQDAGRIELMAALDYKKDKFKGNLNFKYYGDREYYTTSNTNIPARIQLNAKFIYTFSDRDEVSLGIYNILDRENYTNKYGGLDLGRNFRLTYEHTF